MSQSIVEDGGVAEEPGSERSGFLKRHPLVAYFLLAYAITWAIEIPLAASARGLVNVDFPPMMHFLAAFGPMLAAFIVTTVTAGSAGVRELVGRMLRWRVGIGWILVAAFSPVALFLIAATVVGVMAGEWPDLSQFGYVPELPQLGWFGGWILWIMTYGLGEETGWRGFALPRLQKHRGALPATVVLTVFWAFWHGPAFFYREAYMGLGLGGAMMFFLGLLSGAIVFTWLYNSTRGSILMVTLWHGAFNAATSGVPAEIAAIMSAFIMVAAVIIVFVARPANLSRSERHTM